MKLKVNVYKRKIPYKYRKIILFKLNIPYNEMVAKEVKLYLENHFNKDIAEELIDYWKAWNNPKYIKVVEADIYENRFTRYLTNRDFYGIINSQTSRGGGCK